jgi:uncharacterized protein with ATP-grasp and redox domains
VALETAIRISIAGNIIDLGVSSGYDDLEETLGRILYQPFAINHSEALRARLSQAEWVLFFGDNSGEKVFTMLQVKCPVIAGDIGVPVGSIGMRQADQIILR